jgi:tRNA dimethylallyltransferase
MKKLLVVIVGPTAVGKSAVAIELAERIGGEIVSCDSRQVYKYLDIGTAKPTKAERKRVPHHLIDMVTPDEEFNAFLYAQKARQTISGIHNKKKVPILIGGSGLYTKAVIDGIFPGVGKSESIRKKLEKSTSATLHKRLRKIDAETAERLHPNDKLRIIRALEVYQLTGEPISAFQSALSPKRPGYNLMLIGLRRQRSELYQRINERVEGMLTKGLIEEVKDLIKKGFSQDLLASRGLGYKEIIGYLKGEYDLAEAIRLLKRNTRRFAKRQITWYNQEERIHWIEVKGGDSAPAIALRIAKMWRKRK